MPALDTHLVAQGFPGVKVVVASGPSEYFRRTPGTPVTWIPHFYGGCGQHGPNEHRLGLMAGLWWDVGEKARAGL